MQNILKTIGALLCVTTSASALTIDAPDCVVDGTSLYVSKPYAGGIRLSHGFTAVDAPERFFVTACSSGKELRMTLLRDIDVQGVATGMPDGGRIAEGRTVEMLASAKKFSLLDVAERLSDLIVFHEIASIQKQHCICTVEGK